MWASAPTNDHGKTPDFEGRTGSSAPTTGIGKSCVGRKSPRFPFRPPPKTETPRVGTVGRYCIGFRFRAVGVDAYIDPPKAPVLW